LAPRGAILKKLSEYHDHYKIAVVEELMRKVRDQGKELTQQFGLNIQSLESVTDQAPIVKAVNVIIIGALLKRASDIHLVPDRGDDGRGKSATVAGGDVANFSHKCSLGLIAYLSAILRRIV
jgi:hypothetical protein